MGVITIVDADFRLGPVNLWTYPLPKAELTTAMTGTNNDLTIRALRGGVAGNSITITLFDPTTSSTPISVAVVGTAITVTLAVDGTSTITSTAAQVRDAINANGQARSLVDVILAASNDGTGVVTALSSTPLAAGSDTGVETYGGALIDETTVTPSVTAVPLTAHVTGSQPRAKIGTGGMFKIETGLKEISLPNLAKALPGCRFVAGAGGLTRLQFIVPTGMNFRDTAIKMEFRRLLTADTETSNPNDILVVPSCSPVDGDVELKYNITDQQFIPLHLEAWPDSLGVTAYMGTLVL
jgi:hypothetical protein